MAATVLIAKPLFALPSGKALRTGGVVTPTDTLFVTPNVASELAGHGITASDLARAGIAVASDSPIGASPAATQIANILRGLGGSGATSALPDALNLAEAAGLGADAFITQDGQILTAFGGTSILPETGGTSIHVIGF